MKVKHCNKWQSGKQGQGFACVFKVVEYWDKLHIMGTKQISEFAPLLLVVNQCVAVILHLWNFICNCYECQVYKNILGELISV